MVILMSSINSVDLVNSKEILESIKLGKRKDGRGPLDYRDIEIKTGFLSSADGSSWVKVGNTEIIAGIKFAVGTPYPDSPDKGSMSLNLELSGLSSPNFFTGPPQIDSVEFGRVADRAIRHADVINFEDLAIVPGEKVFIAFIDCIAVNADGNLIDATQIAAITALLNAKIPKLDENYNIISREYTDKGISMNLKNIPVSITFDKVADKIILDTDQVEELASSARFSLGIVGDVVTSCHKTKGGVFNEDEINFMIDTAVSKYAEFSKMILDSRK
jgi:exosome complex component RRP42